MRLIFKIPFLLALTLASALSGYELYQRTTDTLILQQPLDRTAYELRAAGRNDEAALLADFVLKHPAIGDAEKARTLNAALEAEHNDYGARAKRFAHGALTGEPTDTDSLLGSLSLDLFVIGDVRDLAVQSWKEVRYDDGDEFIMALSAVGLATTLAPEIDWAPALMKVFKRMGALTGGFINSFKTVIKQSAKTKKAGPVMEVMTDFGKAARRLGPAPLSRVMKNVDSTTDLVKIRKAADLDAAGTYVVTTRFGKNGVKHIRPDGSNIRKLVGSVKAIGRIGKISKKSFAIVPTPWLAVVFLVSAFSALWLLWPRRIRAFHRAIAPKSR